MLDELLRAVAEHYESDPSAAGIVLAQVARHRCYASIVRYHKKFGGEKEVVVNAYASTVEGAIEELSKAWFKIAQVPSQLAIKATSEFRETAVENSTE